MTPAAVLSILVKTEGVGSAQSQLKSLDSTAQKTGRSMSSAAKGVTALAGLAATAGAALFRVGQQFNESSNTMRVATGATGKELDALESSLKNVFKAVPTDLGSATTAITSLSVSLGLTGKPLEMMAKQLLELSRITKTGLSENIDSTSEAFKRWNIATEDQSAALDQLFQASQQTGVPVATLASQLAKFATPLKAFGYNFTQSAAILGGFDKAGFTVGRTMGALNAALGKIVKTGQEPQKVLAGTMKAIKDAGSAAEANTIAGGLFGTKAGPELAAAIRAGRLDLDTLLKQIGGSSDTILGAAKDTETFSEKWRVFRNQILVGLEPLATGVFNAVGRAMEILPGVITSVTDAFRGLVDAGAGVFDSVKGAVEWFKTHESVSYALATAIGILALAYAVNLTPELWSATRAIWAQVGAWAALKLEALANPYVLVALAIAALAAAFVYAYRESARFHQAVDRIADALADAAVKAYNAAVGIGTEIVNGVLEGASFLYSALTDMLESTLFAVLSGLNPFSPVSHGGEKYIGRPLAEGALRGWVTGSAPLPKTLSDTVRAAVEAARTTVQNARGVFEQAWGELASNALSAFDAVMGQKQTPAERYLQQVDDLRAAQDRAGRVLGARDRLTEALSGKTVADASVTLGDVKKGRWESVDPKTHGGQTMRFIAPDPKDLADAQKAYDDAVKQQAKDILAARKELADAIQEQDRHRFQVAAAAERKEMDADIRLKRSHFQKRLNLLMKALSKEGASQGDAHARIKKLFKAFGVDYGAAGTALGESFVTQLQESMTPAEKAAEAIARAVSGKLRAVPGVTDTISKSGASGKKAKVPDKFLEGAVRKLPKATIPNIKKEIQDKIDGVGDAVGKEFDKIAAKIRGFIDGPLTSLGRAFDWTRGRLAELRTAVGPTVGDIGAVISGAWSVVRDVTTWTWKNFSDIIGDNLTGTLGAVGRFYEGVIGLLRGIIDFTVGAFTLDFGRAWKGVTEIFGGAWDVMVGIVDYAWEMVKLSVRLGTKAVGSILDGAWELIKMGARKAWDAVGSAITTPIRAAGTALGTMWAAIKSAASTAWAAIHDAITAPVEAAASTVRRLLGQDGLRGWLDAVWTAIGTAVGRVGSIFGTVFKTIGGAIRPVKTLIDDVKDAVESLVGWIGKIKIPKISIPGFGGEGNGTTVGPAKPLGAGVDSATPIANAFGLVTTSGYRPGDPGWHGQNRARDYAGSAGAMRQFAAFMAASYGPRLLELIHTPLGFGIKNGQRIPSFGAAVDRDHFDHVHVAMAKGGSVKQGGWAVVGEKGPELAHLPGGARVYPNSESVAALGSRGGTTVVVEHHYHAPVMTDRQWDDRTREQAVQYARRNGRPGGTR